MLKIRCSTDLLVTETFVANGGCQIDEDFIDVDGKHHICLTHTVVIEPTTGDYRQTCDDETWDETLMI